MLLFLLSCALCYVTACQSSGPSAKCNRKDFTVSEKVQVIEYKKENPNASVQAIAEKFNWGK